MRKESNKEVIARFVVINEEDRDLLINYILQRTESALMFKERNFLRAITHGHNNHIWIITGNKRSSDIFPDGRGPYFILAPEAPAMILVIFGTFGARLSPTSFSQLTSLPKLIKVILFGAFKPARVDRFDS